MTRFVTARVIWLGGKRKLMMSRSGSFQFSAAYNGFLFERIYNALNFKAKTLMVDVLLIRLNKERFFNGKVKTLQIKTVFC
jgi:hypothetical protein